MMKNHLQRIIHVFNPLILHRVGNFQGITGQSGFRKGIRSREGWKREVAAYLLDRDHLFSVPTTVQVDSNILSFLLIVSYCSSCIPTKITYSEI